jgi:hypothetical protein
MLTLQCGRCAFWCVAQHDHEHNHKINLSYVDIWGSHALCRKNYVLRYATWYSCVGNSRPTLRGFLLLSSSGSQSLEYLSLNTKALGSCKMSYCSPKDTAWHFGRLEFLIELTYVRDGVRQTVGLRFTKLLGGVNSVVQTFTVRILPCNDEEVSSWKSNYSAAVSAVLQLYQRYCSCISGTAGVSAVLQLYQRYCSYISSTACCSLNSSKHSLLFTHAHAEEWMQMCI